MIGNLQETVSQLVYLKRDVKKLKDEILLREKTINSFEKDKENLLMKNEISLEELRNNYEKEMEEMRALNENKIHEIQHESDAKVAQYTCVIEELRSKIKDLEAEHREKVNVVVLEYEEKIQRGAAQIAQLQEQLAHQAARTDANIDAYRRRLEDLEEKLKQSQFKKYLAQSTYPSQYETQVERPYSVDRDRYTDTNSVELDPVLENARSNMTLSQNKASRTNTLQVMYYGQNNNKAKEKKGSFNITKKRKLYSEKDFQDM
ncbi:lamin Dm0-like [Bombyx mandarina]|uniref:Lamin Dm0-like n=1 Tax=Bombyx mandarina TaxID=7092 RepID=A0A6J2K4F6_BOMMA|nr:lamin Dm0-like [Bombyx mandarina]